MKKICFVLLLFCTVGAMSQKKPEIRLNLYAGYVFDDRVDSYYSNTSYYDGIVEGSLRWGLGLEYMFHPSMGVELSYLREDTKAPTTYYNDDGIGDPIKSREFDLGINYILLGATRYFPVKPAIEPFFGIQLGVGIINVSNPTNGEEGNTTKFAWAVKGGSNIWVSEKIGIKLQADVLSLAQAAGGGVYFGTGGVSPGLSTYSTIFQFALGGGIVFKFGQ